MRELREGNNGNYFPRNCTTLFAADIRVMVQKIIQARDPFLPGRSKVATQWLFLEPEWGHTHCPEVTAVVLVDKLPEGISVSGSLCR